METLRNLGKILSIVALVIALIGAISTGDAVFVTTAILSIPYVWWRLTQEFKPWN